MIQQIEIDSMEDLISTLNSLPNNFVYRGHANADWNLESSLERIIGENWSDENAKKFEEYSLTQFSSKFHLYDRENIQPNSKLAWLSLMQHYGVPTRLIDFTESPYVALYFALEFYDPKLHNDIGIFAIDYSAMMDCSLDYIRSKDSDFKETRASLQTRKDEIFKDVVDRFAYDVAWVTEPTQLNARLDKQAGSFLLSGNRGGKIKHILDSDLYKSVEIKKYRISYRMYEGIFALLRKMNITSKSLYGDLDGMARAIRMQMQVYAA